MHKTTATDYYTALSDPQEAIPYMERLQGVVGGQVEKLIMYPTTINLNPDQEPVTQWHLTVTFVDFESGLLLGVDKVGEGTL